MSTESSVSRNHDQTAKTAAHINVMPDAGAQTFYFKRVRSDVADDVFSGLDEVFGVAGELGGVEGRGRGGGRAVSTAPEQLHF